MLKIISPEEVTRFMRGPNAEWFQWGLSDEWTIVVLNFEDLVGKHTQITDWVAKNIITDVYGALYDNDIFPSDEEIEQRLAALDKWINEGKTGIFKKENPREKERAQKEQETKWPTKQRVGYVFCFCTAEDALKFKMVWG